MKTLSKKIWLFGLALVAFTIICMYSFTHFLYERLYVQDAENAMLEVGTNISKMYDGGNVTDEFVAQVDVYNQFSNMNVFAVRNPRELSACVPFDIDYDTLIGAEERKTLLAGENLVKKGYEKRFDRQVISVVVPLVENQRLQGIIYLYFPLEKISELALKDISFIILCALAFLALFAWLIYKGLKLLLKPLAALQTAAEKVAHGQYDVQVTVKSKDEIGRLSTTFNTMAKAIQTEDLERKQFLATVSHELRTPISYIKGYGEAMLQNFLTVEEKEQKMALIVREATRMEKLTTELLQLSRLENNSQQVELYPLPLAEVLYEVVAYVQRQADEKDVTLQLDVDEQIIVSGNEERLKQIFLNVIDNALRYSKQYATIQIQSYVSQKSAIIIIRDEGIGIPSEDLEHVKERFYRVNKARSSNDGGSGLGLSIVDQLVAVHNGTWKIESELNKGTIVQIHLPLLEDEA